MLSNLNITFLHVHFPKLLITEIFVHSTVFICDLIQPALGSIPRTGSLYVGRLVLRHIDLVTRKRRVIMAVVQHAYSLPRKYSLKNEILKATELQLIRSEGE